MDKLFDLMAMGLKYQLLCSRSLGGMLQAGGKVGGHRISRREKFGRV
jgi:hypothetical protein